MESGNEASSGFGSFTATVPPAIAGLLYAQADGTENIDTQIRKRKNKSTERTVNPREKLHNYFVSRDVALKIRPWLQ
jgi:hypothetical protein